MVTKSRDYYDVFGHDVPLWGIGLALFALWLLVNVGGVLLVGWLGVLFANAVFATTYPVYTGWALAALIRLITFIFR